MSGYYRAALTVDTFDLYLPKQFLDAQADITLSFIDDDQGSKPENMASPWGRGEDAGYQQDLRDILAAPLAASQSMEKVVTRDCGYLEGFSKHFGLIESELWTLYDQVLCPLPVSVFLTPYTGRQRDPTSRRIQLGPRARVSQKSRDRCNEV
jgi:hypothetical protein